MQVTISSVHLFAPVVEAVLAGKRVRIDVDGAIVTGTLRAFVPADGEAVHLRHTADLTQSWVRITTTSGPDFWLETTFVATQHSEGACAFS